MPQWPTAQPPAARALFLLLFTATLWVPEAIPGFAVSKLVIALVLRWAEAIG